MNDIETHKNDKDVVLVTGFGPFRTHKINASWETVKLLHNHETDSFKIVAEEVPVEYKYVDQVIPQLWKKYNPKLVIHVGVSHLARSLTLETVANRCGYYSPDATGQCHKTGECSPIPVDTLVPELDIAKICDLFNKNYKSLDVSISSDAGRYLCEYTFFKSLSIDRSRTLFIHVPMLNEPYTAQQMADGLLAIIKICLSMLTKDQNSFKA